MQFGKHAASVEGFLRASRRPAAILATLKCHLTGELSHELATPDELALAVLNYAASNPAGSFNTRYFAGFVRKAKAAPREERSRAQGRAEDRHIAAVRAADERAGHEEADLNRLIAQHQRDFPVCHQRLVEAAERRIPDTIQMGRSWIVRAEVVENIRNPRHAHAE